MSKTTAKLALAPAGVAPLIAALCSAQEHGDSQALFHRLAHALPFADAVIRDGLFDVGVLTRAVHALGAASDGDYTTRAAMLERLSTLADSADGDAWAAMFTDHPAVYEALVMTPCDSMQLGYLVGLAAGLRIGGAR